MKKLKEFQGFGKSFDLKKISGGKMAAYTFITTNCGEIEDGERDED